MTDEPAPPPHRRPRTVAEELEALHEYKDFTQRMHKLMAEFLTVEGLIDWWPVFLFAREAGQPYTPQNKDASSPKG